MDNRISCTKIHYLTTYDSENRPPSDSDNEKFVSLCDKKVGELTKGERTFLSKYIQSVNEFDPEKINKTLLSKIRDYAIYLKYGIGRVSDSTRNSLLLASKNGVLSEGKSIEMVSEYLDIPLVKNEKLIKNKYFSGIPDVIRKEGRKYTFCLDIKTCIDYYRFLDVKTEDVNNHDYWQMQGYMDIMNLDECMIAYVLPNMNESLLESIKRYYISESISFPDSSDKLESKIAQLVKNTNFDFLPIEKRVHVKIVKRDKIGMDFVKKRIPHVIKHMDNIMNDI